MQFVDFTAEDGLRLDGLFVPPADGVTVLHVHGKCGNFYQNDFLRPMFTELSRQGIGFLAFNNRGHDCVAEAYRYGHVTYIGGSLERFEDCVLDVRAAVAYLRGVGSQVVLQGHSHGVEKVLYSARHVSTTVVGVVLVSPSDSYALQQMWRPNEALEDQAVRLQVESSPEAWMDFLPADEYGIAVDETRYPIPVTRGSLVNQLQGEALRILRVPPTELPMEPISVPIMICIGGKDQLQTVDRSVMSAAIQNYSTEPVFLLENAEADHHFHGFEAGLASSIAAWVGALGGHGVRLATTAQLRVGGVES